MPFRQARRRLRGEHVRTTCAYPCSSPAKNDQHRPTGDRRCVREAVVCRRMLDDRGDRAVAGRHEHRRPVQGFAQPPAPQRDGQRHHAAQNGGAKKRREYSARAEQRPKRGEQLDVACAGGPEHVRRQQQRQPEGEPAERTADCHATHPSHRQHQAHRGEAHRQDVRHTAPPDVDDRRGDAGPDDEHGRETHGVSGIAAAITSQNTLTIVEPTSEIAVTATSVTSPTSSAYSMRSWARSSRRTRRHTAIQIPGDIETSLLRGTPQLQTSHVKRRPLAGPPCVSRAYDPAPALASLSLIETKILFTSVPASVRATTQTSEISATSSAYSIRSWPSSSRTNVLMLFTNFMSSPPTRITRVTPHVGGGRRHRHRPTPAFRRLR